METETCLLFLTSRFFTASLQRARLHQTLLLSFLGQLNNCRANQGINCLTEGYGVWKQVSLTS